MAYKLFAAIYVGSSEISMKIYEINGRKSFRQIDGVTKIIELGKDTYRKGSLSTTSIRQVCEILNEFKKKMHEYQITDYRAYATSAIREAENTEFILDSIKRNVHLLVQVLSNSEQRYMNFKGLVAKYKNFHQVVSKNTAFVDVGAGSVQISLFDKNNLSVTENIPIGAVRIRDYLSIVGRQSGRLDQIIAEYVESDIVTFRNLYLNDKEIKNIIVVGEVVETIKRMMADFDIDEQISKDQFTAIYNRVVTMNPQALAERYGIPYERATLVLPTILIYKSFLNNCKADEIYIPKVDFCDGITAAYMDEGSRVVFEHDFTEDILASAYSISKRYKCNRSHVERTSDIALKIFDSVKKIHGMGKIERLQLQIAAILHECGNYINMHNGAENSYYIVANTEILGLSHKERMEVANIVKYNMLYLPDYARISSELDGADYLTVAKLAAILRIANILDKSHLQKIEDISVSIKDSQMIIFANTYEDISLEAGLFETGADFFEKVYGLRPVLRQKRSV
ncbi:MAG: HD domain-containing protein [Eubacteriales bacterium]|nr:HD domain-containing protein [Lachnospiraceae bacterium]MDO5127379.1 HD domain-containing protein [Eubacteriales bacterium]